VPAPAATVAAIAEHERKAGASIDLLDGLTVEHGDWWYNLRPSNTEPLLRLNVEAKTPALCRARGRGAAAHRHANAGLACRMPEGGTLHEP
jgi:phosphomannomutase